MIRAAIMMANAETCYVPLTRLGGAILSKQKLDPKWRELVILMVAKIEGGEYEWVQHVPIGLALGASQDQINAIAAHSLEASCFNDAERTLLRFTEEVINKVRADETTVRDLMKYLSPREIVETIMTIGFYILKMLSSTGAWASALRASSLSFSISGYGTRLISNLSGERRFDPEFGVNRCVKKGFSLESYAREEGKGRRNESYL